MSEASERRQVLRTLLLAGQPGTQTELCTALSERGYQTTQSTVSRDLKLLGAQRIQRDDGAFAYHLRPRQQPEFPGHMVLSVLHNETTIVLRTQVGRAPAVGSELDALNHDDILGTLSGDDTVLVIPRTVSVVESLSEHLRRLAGVTDLLPPN